MTRTSAAAATYSNKKSKQKKRKSAAGLFLPFFYLPSLRFFTGGGLTGSI
jgi:hypothetical protein